MPSINAATIFMTLTAADDTQFDEEDSCAGRSVLHDGLCLRGLNTVSHGALPPLIAAQALPGLSILPGD